MKQPTTEQTATEQTATEQPNTCTTVAKYEPLNFSNTVTVDYEPFDLNDPLTKKILKSIKDLFPAKSGDEHDDTYDFMMYYLASTLYDGSTSTNFFERPQSARLSIGVDYGGVCSWHDDNYEASSKTEADNKTNDASINMPDCVESLEKLKSLGHRLVLISFCGASRARKTRAMLEPLELFDVMYFVKKRKYKQLVCQKEGIDIMIDDRLDVLQTIKTAETVLFDMFSHGSNILESKDSLGRSHNVSKPTMVPNKTCSYKPDHRVLSWLWVVNIVKNMKQKKNLPVDTDLSGKCHA